MKSWINPSLVSLVDCKAVPALLFSSLLWCAAELLCCFWVRLQCAGLEQLLVILPAAGAAQVVIDRSKGKHVFFVPSSDVVSHCGNQLMPHKAAIKKLAKERPGRLEKKNPWRNYKNVHVVITPPHHCQKSFL